MSSLIIPFPAELRPRLPTIMGNVDYLTLRQQIQTIDELLRTSGLETDFLETSLKAWLPAGKKVTARQQQKFQLRSSRALRCNILRTLLQEDYRGFSCQLAGNPLYQWFCLCDSMDVIKVPSKSELQRYSQWLPAETMRGLNDRVLSMGMHHHRKLKISEAIDLAEYFLDTTSLKANVHFPVDWVLLRDAVRTLMKAAKLIRHQGLKERMEEPEEFLRRINRLSIEMTHQRESTERAQGRKRVLRRMKKVVRVVQAHAQRHRELLDQQWEKTEWTRPQADQVLQRIDSVLELLPKAQKQAHERIIGERLVKNEDKILSLYEPDIHVIVRGKAGAAVEFGNTALLGENRQGLILDYQLIKDQAPADSQLLMDSLTRIWERLGQKVGAVAADRGFSNQENQRVLNESETFNAICPRDPKQLKKRMKEKKFARLQRRRSQTEARIGILINQFFGKPMRAKGFENRELAMSWGVLTHNLWVLARMRKKKKSRKSKNKPLQQAA